jgi:TRAP transporter TAXI family solute receptor
MGVSAQEIAYYRIGAGAPGSSSFDLAGLVGGAISAPPGSRQCDVEGPCGVTGLQATAHAAESAVDSLLAVGAGELESAVASADLVSQAARHEGPFAKRPALPPLNALANVGWSYLHILVAVDSQVQEGAALRGKRVALGAKNSDNALTAQFVLKAAELSTKAVTAMEGDIDSMAQALDNGKASALAIVDGIVSPDVERLVKTGKYRLIPMTMGSETADSENQIIVTKVIPAGAYGQAFGVPTLAVPFTWVVRADADPKLVTSLAEALRRTAEHPQTSVTGAARASIELDVTRLPIPFHPGAAPVLQGFVQPSAPSNSQDSQTN